MLDFAVWRLGSKVTSNGKTTATMYVHLALIRTERPLPLPAADVGDLGPGLAGCVALSVQHFN